MEGRTRSLRRARLLVMTPRLVIAAVIWLLIGAALPWPGGWVLLGLLAVGTWAGVAHEPLMVRLLWGARTPQAPLPAPGGVSVLVTRRRLAQVAVVGRRHLVVPEAWLSRSDLDAVLAAARRRQLVSAGRWDVAYRFVAAPWLGLADFATVFGQGVAVLPMVGFAWKIRPVVTAIAVVQAAQAQRYSAAVVVVLVIGLTYLLPWTLRHEATEVDRAAASLPQQPRPTPASAPPATTAAPLGRPVATKRRPVAPRDHGMSAPSVRHQRIAAHSRPLRG